MTNDDSFITTSSSGMSFVGADAVRLYQAVALRSALRLYAKTGMIPTRGVTLTRMLNLAAEIQGRKRYPKARTRNIAAERAATDLDQWIAAMKAALPIVKEDR